MRFWTQDPAPVEWILLPRCFRPGPGATARDATPLALPEFCLQLPEKSLWRVFHSAKQHGNPPAPAKPALSPSALVLRDPGRRFACTYPKTLRTSCVPRRVFLRKTTHPPARSLRAQRRCRRELPDTFVELPSISAGLPERPLGKEQSRSSYGI